MADRYLLESGSPDGYLLEDGSGVLLLDVLPVTLNPSAISPYAQLLNSNLTFQTKSTSGTTKAECRATAAAPSSQCQFEVTVSSLATAGGGTLFVGVDDGTWDCTTDDSSVPGAFGEGVILQLLGGGYEIDKNTAFVRAPGTPTLTLSDTVSVVIDKGAGTVTFYLMRGGSQIDNFGGAISWTPPTGSDWYAWVGASGAGFTVDAKFGSGQVRTLDSGYSYYDSSSSSPASQEVDPPLLTNSQTFYGPSVNLVVAPALLTNSQTFYAPTVSPGAVTITPSLLGNSQTFYGANLSLNLLPALLTNGQSFFAPQLNLKVTPALLTNSPSFPSAKINLNLAPPLLTNGQTFYGPTVSQGLQISAPQLSDSQSFYAAAITPGPVTISPTLLSSGQSFPAAQLNLAVDPPLIATSQTFFAATVNQTIHAPEFANDAAFYGPTVTTTGIQTINAPLLDEGNLFFAFDAEGAPRQYPLAGIEQPYPSDQPQTYPLAGVLQQYPLA